MAHTSPNPIECSDRVHSLLNRLHKVSEEEETTFEIGKFSSDDLHDAMRNKFIALDEDKCHCLYQICRATNAKNIVEAGTSFGVSTIYLSLAVGRNIQGTGGTGSVIATEHEPTKADKARAHWAEAGEEVARLIDLRVGDLRETLQRDIPTVDLLLLDIWAPMTLPTLRLVQPHLRYGAVVIIDNTISSASRYKDLLAYMRAPDSGFLNLTLPYPNGLEMSLYVPSKAS